jgi:hypothetical protein
MSPSERTDVGRGLLAAWGPPASARGGGNGQRTTITSITRSTVPGGENCDYERR